MQVLLQGIVEKWTDKHTERQWGKPATTAVSPSSSIGVWVISPSLGTFSCDRQTGTNQPAQQAFPFGTGANHKGSLMSTSTHKSIVKAPAIKTRSLISPQKCKSDPRITLKSPLNTRRDTKHILSRTKKNHAICFTSHKSLHYHPQGIFLKKRVCDTF